MGTGIVPNMTVMDSLNWHAGGCMFIFFILLSSDIFINNMLVRINGTVSGRSVTHLGVLIQATLMMIFYFIITSAQIGVDE